MGDYCPSLSHTISLCDCSLFSKGNLKVFLGHRVNRKKPSQTAFSGESHASHLCSQWMKAAPHCHALTSQYCTSCTQSLLMGSVFPHLGCYVVPKTGQQCPAFLRLVLLCWCVQLPSSFPGACGPLLLHHLPTFSPHTVQHADV